jgi:hypothetical protein
MKARTKGREGAEQSDRIFDLTTDNYEEEINEWQHMGKRMMQRDLKAFRGIERIHL